MNLMRLSPKRPVGRALDRMYWSLVGRFESPETATRTALASFPRSGSTWLRVMLEKASGFKSGTVYRRDQVFRDCEQMGMRGFIVKTHELDGYRYHRAVLLVRHPYDAIESYFAWRRDTLGKQEAWQQLVRETVPTWKQHVEYWLDRPYEVLTVRYEDLIADTEAQLGRTLRFLDCEPEADVVRATVAECTIEGMRNSPEAADYPQFFRRGASGCGKASFDQQQVDLVSRELGPAMAKLGYEA